MQCSFGVWESEKGVEWTGTEPKSSPAKAGEPPAELLQDQTARHQEGKTKTKPGSQQTLPRRGRLRPTGPANSQPPAPASWVLVGLHRAESAPWGHRVAARSCKRLSPKNDMQVIDADNLLVLSWFQKETRTKHSKPSPCPSSSGASLYCLELPK